MSTASRSFLSTSPQRIWRSSSSCFFGEEDSNAVIDRAKADERLSVFTADEFDSANPPDVDWLTNREPLDGDSPIIARLLDLILSEMLVAGTERAMITPRLNGVAVRLDINGTLRERDRLPCHAGQALAERVLAGAAKTPMLERFYVRVSSVEFGQEIELRLKRSTETI